MIAVDTITNQAEILGRSLDLHAEAISPDVAEFLLSIELTDSDRNRMNALVEKGGQAPLTPSEAKEAEEYRRHGRMMEIMQLKARIAMKNGQ